MQTTQHVAFVRRAVEDIWNQGELDVADELFAATYVNHGGLIPDVMFGPEAIKFSVAMYRLAYPDLQITVEHLRSDGDTVVFQWTAQRASVSHRSGDAATPTSNTLTGTITSHIADGRIGESWVEWDNEDAMAQLGVLPPID